jgi:hypothetical protein
MIRECWKTSTEMRSPSISLYFRITTCQVTCTFMVIVFTVSVIYFRQRKPTPGVVLEHRTQSSLVLLAVRFLWVDSTYFQGQVISFPLVWSDVQFDVRLSQGPRLNCNICPFTFTAAVRHCDTRYLLISAASSAVVRRNGGDVARIVPRRTSDDSISHKDLMAILTGAEREYHIFRRGSNVPARWGTAQCLEVTETYKQSENQ